MLHVGLNRNSACLYQDKNKTPLCFCHFSNPTEPSSLASTPTARLSSSVGTLSLSLSLSLTASLAPSLRAEVNHALRPCSHCVSSATSVWGLCVPLISRGAMLSPECVSVSVCVYACVCVCVPCPHYVATLGGQHGKFLLHYTPPSSPPSPLLTFPPSSCPSLPSPPSLLASLRLSCTAMIFK